MYKIYIWYDIPIFGSSSPSPFGSTLCNVYIICVQIFLENPRSVLKGYSNVNMCFPAQKLNIEQFWAHIRRYKMPIFMEHPEGIIWYRDTLTFISCTMYIFDTIFQYLGLPLPLRLYIVKCLYSYLKIFLSQPGGNL